MLLIVKYCHIKKMTGLEDGNTGDTGIIFYSTILVNILYIRHSLTGV